MLPVTFALAALLDESVSFDGVIRFDALQAPGTGPGSLAPNSPLLLPPATTLSTATLSDCQPSCSDTTRLAGGYGITNFSTITSSMISTSTCGASCSARRSLLQTRATGQTVVYTITGATVAQLQALQNNIAAGNLVPFGIPATAQISSTSPSTGTFNFQGNTAGVTIPPSNPASPIGVSLCNNTPAVTVKSSLPCVDPVQCSLWIVQLSAANIQAICCACSGARRALLQNVGQLGLFAPVAAAPLAQVCAVLGNVNGCGKQSKKGLLGLLGLLGLIPLFLVLLLCCLCLLRRKRRGQAMMFSQTHQPQLAPVPLPPPAHLHAPVPVGAPAF